MLKYLVVVGWVAVLAGWAVHRRSAETPGGVPLRTASGVDLVAESSASEVGKIDCSKRATPKDFAACVAPAIARLVIAVEHKPPPEHDSSTPEGAGQLYIFISTGGDVVSIDRVHYLASKNLIALRDALDAVDRVERVWFDPEYPAIVSCTKAEGSL